MTTSKELYVAISDMHDHFKKIEGIISSLSNEARDALLNFHGADNNLIYVARCGASNSHDLLEKLHHGEVAFVRDPDNGILVLNNIDLPFKASSFPSINEERALNEIIYVPERPDSIHDSFTAIAFVRIIDSALGSDKSSYTQEQIERMALCLWETTEWQHPETLIDELGIEFFKEALPKFVIMLPEQGFWGGINKWVPDVESSIKYFSNKPGRPITMPSLDWLHASVISEADAVDFDVDAGPEPR